MAEQQTEYRQIMKATSIFGGVQVFNIIISIIRSKVIALLLGPTGMGIVGLLTSTSSLIAGLTNFGLGTSAVKDVAAAEVSGNTSRIAIIVTVLRRLVWATGILGTSVVLILSPWLSELTFGNRDYTMAFAWISITLLFGQLSSGQLVILQGMRKLKYLAKASILGSVSGLIVSLPLYYYFGLDGIVPAIFLTSVMSLIISWYFSRKVKIEKVILTQNTLLKEGKNMLLMGFVIAINGLVIIAVSYIVRVFISKKGGIEDVGLYTAGFAIINSYVGMVFSAMLTDYYPRLSAVAHDTKLSNQTINQQADIALLIIAPIVVVFLVFIHLVIIILLSNKFLAVTGMINWAMLGIFFKAAGWPIGFIFIPKGNSRLFLFSELAANLYMLLLNIAGYYFWGLEGLGISFLIGYIFYSLQVLIIANIKYDFHFEHSYYRMFFIQFTIAIICFVSTKFLTNPYPYIVGAILIGFSTIISYKELDKRIGLKHVFLHLKNKF
jgi:O-antigen/teichoic acid export membrane protein